jgi:hypothetical protein
MEKYSLEQTMAMVGSNGIQQKWIWAASLPSMLRMGRSSGKIRVKNFQQVEYTTGLFKESVARLWSKVTDSGT